MHSPSLETFSSVSLTVFSLTEEAFKNLAKLTPCFSRLKFLARIPEQRYNDGIKDTQKQILNSSAILFTKKGTKVI